MGMFSYKCRGCGHPLLSEYATNRINDWMQDAVVLHKDYGLLAQGQYDGYGVVPLAGDAGSEGGTTYRLGYDEESGDCMEAVWHNACWTKAGKPLFDEPSKSAEDQGYFFKSRAHDMVNPLEAN